MEPAKGLPSVLIICTYFPPQNSTAARRPYHLARRLAERGHRVSVLTSELEPGTRWETDLTGLRIMRMPRTFTLPDGNALQQAIVRGYWRTMGRRMNVIYRTLGFLFTPMDLHDRLHLDEEAVDRELGPHEVIVATGPRWSIFEFGHRLAERWNSCSLVDYRDPWNLVLDRIGVRAITWYGDGPIGWLKRRRMRRLERRFTQRAAAVTSVSPPMLGNAILSTGITRAGLVYNGSNPAPSLQHPVRGTHFMLLYSGRLSVEQEWPTVIGAFDRMHAERPELASKIKLILLGPVTADPHVLASLEACGARTGMIEVRPGVDRVPALMMQSAADVLLNVSFADLSGIVPVKLLEYLHARRPILQISSNPDVQEAILGRTRTGEVIASSDALIEYLARQVGHWERGEDLPYAPDLAAIAEFRHERQMDKWVDLIQAVYAEQRSRA